MHPERLFLALKPAPSLVRDLAAFQTELAQRPAWREIAPGPRWIPPENLHLTLHFLGDVPSDKLPALQTALASRPFDSGFPTRLELAGLHGFPTPENATVLVLRGGECPALFDLHERLKPVLAGLGIALEKRAYSPHLTLARFRRPTRLPAAEATPVFPLEVASFALFRSRRGETGSRYEMIQVFPLAEPVPT